MPVVSTEEAIKAIANGEIIILVDDEDRENEGDFVMAAEWVTPEAITFMMRHGGGLICLPSSGERLDELEIPLMVAENTEVNKTAFCVSIDAKHGITTGVSAHDRARTIRAVVDPKTRPRDLARPGHVFPLRAAEGGVLQRTGHTEGAVDLARLAGCQPVAVLCEIIRDDGMMARMPDLEKLAAEHGLKIATIRDIVAYRRRTEKLVHRVAETRLPTPYGEWKLIDYRCDVEAQPYIALVKGEINPDEPVLVRVHSGCLTGDVFHSLRCDCGEQLEYAMRVISEEGKGVIVYIPAHEGRGIGLHNKMRAYRLQDEGADTVEANEMLGFKPDIRDYGLGAQVLVDLGVRRMRLLTNNPSKHVALEGYGLEVVERVPIEVPPNRENRKYLETKRDKLGHELHLS